ncbi:hypothetical protein [Cupriavidus sp. CuC1]|uniref:hypothetical protein n=1 Tax=Cupriavidus sp. CuC1 TaxID=3373131 RepID=UPI0037D3505D
MNTPDTALQGQNTTITGWLYMAFELGEKGWTQAHWRWLEGVKFAQPVQQIVLQEYMDTVKACSQRVASLECMANHPRPHRTRTAILPVLRPCHRGSRWHAHRHAHRHGVRVRDIRFSAFRPWPTR